MGEISMRESYGKALAAYGEKNPKVFVVDVDTSASTLTHFFAAKFPDRFVNVGIAEPCSVDLAVGLALAGMTPFANGFAALLSLRALEQIRTCVCYARTNVKLAASYAGLSDFKDGPTHYAMTDVAIMRAMPEMRVIVPADAAEIAAWVPVIAENDGPVYLRISRASHLRVHEDEPIVEFGKGEILKTGDDLTIIAMGSMVGRSMKAADVLEHNGIHARIINLSSVKPLDRELILQCAQETGAIVTAEEHSIIGGLGGAVAELLAEECPTPITRVGINDRFALTGPDPEAVLDYFGMGEDDIVSAAERVMCRKGH